jgi:hypothetical protein
VSDQVSDVVVRFSMQATVMCSRDFAEGASFWMRCESNNRTSG